MGTLARAQDTLPRIRGYFGIAVGAGFPINEYVKKDFSDDKAGFANTGSNLQLNFCRYIYKDVGILLRGNINTNPYDVYELAKSYNTRDTFSNISYSVNSKNWYFVGGLAGLNYRIPLHDFGIELRALAGYQYAESPKVKTTLTTGSDSSTITISAGYTYGMFWTTGAAVSYHLTTRTSIAVNVEYCRFNGIFHGSQVFIDDQPISARDDFSMNVEILNCTAALRFHF